MSDINQLAPVSTPSEIPAAPVAETPLSEREQIYARYYANETPAPPAVAETVQTPAPVAAESVVPPSQSPTSVPSTDPMAAVLEELKALRAQVNQQAQPAPIPAPSVLAPGEQKDWLALMAEGKKAEGEALFAKKVEEQISERIQQQAMERMEANRTIYEFSTKIRNDNPDLASMEPYIGTIVQAQMNAAVAAGKIKSPADYATVYKESVTAEVEKARNLVNTFRGVGKNEALTRSKEVVSTQTLQPQAINQNRETPSTQEAPQETTDDYFAQRRQRSLAGRGLTVA